MIENILPCSRKKGCFCTFNDFKTFVQLSFPSLPQTSTSFSQLCLSKRPFFSRTSFPARKAVIIFCCVLLCAVQDAQCNTEESPEVHFFIDVLLFQGLTFSSLPICFHLFIYSMTDTCFLPQPLRSVYAMAGQGSPYQAVTGKTYCFKQQF